MTEPRLLMADLRAVDGTTEAEPVLVDHDGDRVTLTLDDGRTLVLDERELRSTLDEQEAA